MGKGRGHIPMRTCISCGAKRPKKDLIRLGLDKEGRLVKDYSCKIHCRGAYVCDEESCMEQLPGNRRLGALFRKDNDFGGLDDESQSL
jgi:predicted RNA-binding protein YlxR (DUF448 family)